MAITKPTEAVAYTISEEITARNTQMQRVVSIDPATSKPVVSFGIYIDYESVTYELDSNGDKVDIFDRKSLGFFNLPPEQVGALWFEPIKLADGTDTTMGNHLADLIDKAIADHIIEITPPVVVIPDPAPLPDPPLPMP